LRQVRVAQLASRWQFVRTSSAGGGVSGSCAPRSWKLFLTCAGDSSMRRPPVSAGRDLSDVPVSRGLSLLFDDDRAAGDVTARCEDLGLAAGRPRGRSRARLGRWRRGWRSRVCMDPGSGVGEVSAG
jgi:hypothetical protein